MLELSRCLRAASLLAAVLGLAVAQSDFTPALSHSAPDHLIFGPKHYLRTTGAPDQSTDTFTVPTSVGAPFLLYIVNGDANGGHRVSSATITVNGVPVFGPDDFNQHAAGVDRPVTLQPTNTLTVRVVSTPGSYLTIYVFGTPKLGNLTEVRVGHTATLLPSGRVLLAGGTGAGGVLNTAEQFDPVTLSVTALTGSLTTERTTSAFVIVARASGVRCAPS